MNNFESELQYKNIKRMQHATVTIMINMTIILEQQLNILNGRHYLIVFAFLFLFRSTYFKIL